MVSLDTMDDDERTKALIENRLITIDLITRSWVIIAFGIFAQRRSDAKFHRGGEDLEARDKRKKKRKERGYSVLCGMLIEGRKRKERGRTERKRWPKVSRSAFAPVLALSIPHYSRS